jgi:hypothetical protein
MAAVQDDPILQSRLDLLMEHRDERQAEEENWAQSIHQVIQPIRSRLKQQDWSEDCLQRCIGLIRTNATQAMAMCISSDGRSIEDKDMATIRVLYPSMSLMSHSCIPNIRTIHRPGYTLEARTLRALKAGEELTISYTGEKKYYV